MCIRDRSCSEQIRFGPWINSLTNHPVYSPPSYIFFISCLEDFTPQVVCNVDFLLDDAVIHVDDVEATIWAGRKIDGAKISIHGGDELSGGGLVVVGQFDMPDFV